MSATDATTGVDEHEVRRRALGRLLGGEVVELRRLTGGASRVTEAGRLRADDGAERRFVLQRTPEVATGSGLAVPMRLQAATMRAAAAEGVSVPAVLAAAGDEGAPPEIGTDWMVLDWVDGESIARRILRDDTYADARRRLVAGCGEALAGIHRVAPATVPELIWRDPLASIRETADVLGVVSPAVELGFRWLEANRPAGNPHTVVHGDFRLGNVLVGPEGLRSVLDWELTGVGDPVEDLGWLCVRSWRFGGPGPVAGVGERQELLDAYAAAGGRRIGVDELLWWETCGTLRWTVMCHIQASASTAEHPSVERAAIGRRACESEHDLLLLLPGGEGVDVPATGGPVAHPDGPHDPPSVPALLTAVAAHLRDEVVVADDLAGAVRFNARIAANVVDQVRRQWERGTSDAEVHARRLALLGVADDAELAAAVRAGELDDRRDEVVAVVRAAVADKVAVSNPRWAAGPPPRAATTSS